eukprot:Gb_39378 [translate_table: standard]
MFLAAKTKCHQFVIPLNNTIRHTWRIHWKFESNIGGYLRHNTFNHDAMQYENTLQAKRKGAIAVAACLKEDWPVLIITPSSLRLQWALTSLAHHKEHALDSKGHACDVQGRETLQKTKVVLMHILAMACVLLWKLMVFSVYRILRVVMSQWAGSNRGGFNIVQSSGRHAVQLDGVFNILSYDLVSKLQDTLSNTDFKASIQYHVGLLL